MKRLAEAKKALRRIRSMHRCLVTINNAIRISADARRYPFLDGDRDDWDLRILSRPRLEDCALLSRHGEHRFVGKAGRDHQPWTAVPDVASAALQAELREEINISDPKAANSRRETFSSILSIKPLSSFGWLSLSGLRW